MGIKQLYIDNLRKLPNEYGDFSVMRWCKCSEGANAEENSQASNTCSCYIFCCMYMCSVRPGIHVHTVRTPHAHKDQPKKKALFSRFAAEHPLREITFYKHHLFRRVFSPRNFAEKLRENSQRNSAKFHDG